jgi:hypothetical protein
LPDQDIGVQPDQRALGVVVHGAAIVRVVAPRFVEDLRGHGRVFERSPGAAELGVERGGLDGQRFAEVLRALEAAPRRQNLAQVIRQTFVDPQQAALHGRVVAAIGAARGEPHGPAILAVPGVHELVRQQGAGEFSRAGVDQGALAQAVVAGFVVLQAEVRHVVAEGEEEVIIAVVARAE